MDNIEAAIQNGFNQVAGEFQTRIDQAVVNIQTSIQDAVDVQGAMIDHLNESMHERFDEVVALLGGHHDAEGEQGGGQGGDEDGEGGSDDDGSEQGGGSDDDSDDDDDDDGDEGAQPLFVCPVEHCLSAFFTQNALNAHGRAHMKQCPYCMGWFRNLRTHRRHCPVHGPNMI